MALDRISQQVERALARLEPMRSMADLDAAKALLVLIAKTLILTSQLKVKPPPEYDADLMAQIFVQLPEEKREQFEHFVERGIKERTLLELRKYLQDEIILYAKVYILSVKSMH